jgi:hypothetical protein
VGNDQIGFLDVSFRPIDQGSVYWKHTWCNDASLTGRFGVADKPNDFIFGIDGRAPISQSMALIGSVTYLKPVGTGVDGQTTDMWNVSVGVEFVPGGFRHGQAGRFTPVLPVADNGTFCIREVR